MGIQYDHMEYCYGNLRHVPEQQLRRRLGIGALALRFRVYVRVQSLGLTYPNPHKGRPRTPIEL